MTIYLVEDDAIYAEFIKKSLSSNPSYVITIYKSAEDAWKGLTAKLPDVLIVDYRLPAMSGFDLYEKLKPRLTDTKVIMLSSLDDGNMVLNFIQRGVRDYVIKDENVIESLESVLNGSEDDYYLFN